MLDIVGLTQAVHRTNDVSVTVDRASEDDRTERVTLWLGPGEFSHGNTNQVASRDLLTANITVDLKIGDRITCDDFRVVQSATTWELVERHHDAGDPNEQSWWMQDIDWFEEA